MLAWGLRARYPGLNYNKSTKSKPKISRTDLGRGVGTPKQRLPCYGPPWGLCSPIIL